MTDIIDGWIAKLIAYINNKYPNSKSPCKEFKYQILDKTIDLLSYCLLYLYLGLNPIYLALIIIRFAGIALFYATLDSSWLIAFPDLFKEVLLYEWFVSKPNYINLSAITIFKIIFEYIWHNYTNHNNYKSQ